ncbi:hypothetical protein FHX82_005163 [Amycolatopsis bartoniae]|nr:hypothetical protein [Amycolatopsis bartoniae]
MSAGIPVRGLGGVEVGDGRLAGEARYGAANTTN